jgi:hypothetical protein
MQRITERRRGDNALEVDHRHHPADEAAYPADAMSVSVGPNAGGSSNAAAAVAVEIGRDAATKAELQLRVDRGFVASAGYAKEMPRMRDLAEGLRNFPALAGVTRRQLVVTDRTRKAITWHDLRATGITWMAIRGDDPLHIQHRAGHSSFSTTQGYIRQAEAVRAGFGDVFPALHVLIAPDTERSKLGERQSWGAESTRESLRRGRDSNPRVRSVRGDSRRFTYARPSTRWRKYAI